jgi:hypothetical protein
MGRTLRVFAPASPWNAKTRAKRGGSNLLTLARCSPAAPTNNVQKPLCYSPRSDQKRGTETKVGKAIAHDSVLQAVAGRGNILMTHPSDSESSVPILLHC